MTGASIFINNGIIRFRIGTVQYNNAEEFRKLYRESKWVFAYYDTSFGKQWEWDKHPINYFK